MMVKFGVDTVAEAMELGQEAAGKVTEKFVKHLGSRAVLLQLVEVFLLMFELLI